MMRGNQQTTTTTVQVAGGVDRSGAVLILGVGLILVNFVFGSGAPMLAYLSGKSSTVPKPTYKPLLLEVLAVFLLLLLAKTGEVGGNLAVIFLAAVAVVWLLNNNKALASILGQSSPPPSGYVGPGGGGGNIHHL